MVEISTTVCRPAMNGNGPETKIRGRPRSVCPPARSRSRRTQISGPRAELDGQILQLLGRVRIDDGVAWSLVDHPARYPVTFTSVRCGPIYFRVDSHPVACAQLYRLAMVFWNPVCSMTRR